MTRKINELSIPTDGLVLDLPLDGNANARVGSNGVATNVTWVWADRWYVSEVGSFNGSNSYVSHNAPILNTQATFSFWIYPNNAGTWLLSIVSNWENARYRIDLRNNKLEAIFWWFDKWITTNWTWDTPLVNVDNNIYQYFTITVDWNNIKVYKNWILKQSSLKASDMNTSWSTSLIWCEPDSWDIWNLWNWFPWNIGLLKIYNKALSQEEIDALYSEGLRKFWPFAAIGSSEYTNIRTWLVGEWGLNDNALDSSGNDNHWTPSNLEYSPVWWGKVGSFNGSSTYIINPSTSWTILDNNFSISLSFKVDSSASSQWFLYSFWERDLWIRWGNVTDNIQFQLFDWTTNAYLNCPVEKNKYYEAVFVRDKINWMSIYLNWVLCASNSYTWNALSLLTRNEQVWRREVVQYFKWQIWLVKIYNKALSQEEINSINSEGIKYIYPQVYTPASLPTPILDISRSANSWIYYDQSWNGNNGTATNVTDSVKGKYNVMSFNGSTSFINITSTSLATLLNWRNPFSISIWVKLDTLTAWQIILDTRWSDFNWFFIELDSNSKLKAVRSDWAVADTIAICNNAVVTWTFCNLVITYDWTNGKMYRDWIEQTWWTSTRTLNSNWDFKIGKWFAWNSSFWYLNWSLINTKIYNSELNKVQAEQDYYSSFIPN